MADDNQLLPWWAYSDTMPQQPQNALASQDNGWSIPSWQQVGDYAKNRLYGAANSIYGAVTAPGDAYAGRLDPYSDEGLSRINALAGLMTMGSGAGKAPANALRSGLARTAEDEAAPITAYHGSPYSFDQFDTSKIGSGEGAQAYGHGLYFAENEGVAKSYKDTLAGKGVDLRSTIEKHLGEDLPVSQSDLGVIYSAAVNGDKDPLGAARAVQARLPHMRDGSFIGPPTPNQQKLSDAISALRDQSRGSMYQVAINAHPDHFLDWDKPLSEQSPVVQQKLIDNAMAFPDKPNVWVEPRGKQFQVIADNVMERRLFPTQDAAETYAEQQRNTPVWYTAGRTAKPQTGSELYSHLVGNKVAFDKQGWAQQAAGATQELQQAGIPGIKYLDQGSRGKGGGTRNFVVFDPKHIDILKKYGIPASAISTAAAASANSQDKSDNNQ